MSTAARTLDAGPEGGLEAGLAALRRGDAAGAAVPADAAPRLAAYLALLAKWNRTYNLTAIREPERMVTHHVLDALAVLPHLPQRPGLRVLDVGSGGGIPGIPLAIARPAWRVVLLDSSDKKCAFLRQAVIELPLGNAEVACARIEDYAPAAPFDVVIARAFADVARFAALGERLVAPGGVLAAMLGLRPQSGLAHLPRGVRVASLHALKVPGLDAQRHLVVLEHDAGVRHGTRGAARAVAR